MGREGRRGTDGEYCRKNKCNKPIKRIKIHSFKDKTTDLFPGLWGSHSKAKVVPSHMST